MTLASNKKYFLLEFCAGAKILKIGVLTVSEKIIAVKGGPGVTLVPLNY